MDESIFSKVMNFKKKITKNKTEFFIIILSLFIFSVNILDFPIHADFGLQGYIGQELIRGYPIFSTAAWTFPPMVYLINAFWMKLFFFLPNYLAMRLGGVILGSISILLFYKILTKCTKNNLIPIFSALILLSFTAFIEFSLGISNKTILLFFVFSMFFFLFKKYYLFTGVLTSLSFITWQGGGLFLFGPFSYYFLNKESRKNYVKFFVGFVIPLILVILYFLSNNLLDKLINYAFIFTLGYKKESIWMRNTIFTYIRGLVGYYNTELLFIFLALITIPLFLSKSIKRKVSNRINNKELFSFIFPYFLLFVYTIIDFQGDEDIIPLLPIISLSSAFILNKIRKKIPLWIVLSFLMIYGFFPMFQAVYPPNPLIIDAKPAKNINDLFDVMNNYTYPEIVYYSLFHRRGKEVNLEHQLKLVEYINDNMNDTDTIFSLGAPELIFLSGKRNINNHLLLSSEFMRVYAMREGITEKLKYKIMEEMPKFIVSWNIPNNKPAIDFLSIEEFLKNNYKEVNIHPKYVIWQRLEK